jgi:hypothetical protein
MHTLLMVKNTGRLSPLTLSTCGRVIVDFGPGGRADREIIYHHCHHRCLLWVAPLCVAGMLIRMIEHPHLDWCGLIVRGGGESSSE